MASPDRRTPTDLRDDLKLSLLKRGREFSFIQAVRLLRLYTAAPSTQDAAVPYQHELLQIVPHLSLAFPASDLESVEEHISSEEENTFKIEANFLSLYGTCSPLPVFYTEELLDEAGEEESASRDFLDIIHQRLYLVFFQSWLKYRQFQQVCEEQDQGHLDRLFCLLGLGESDFRQGLGDTQELLRYIGLFSQAPRSAQGLKTILTDSLHLPVEIISCVQRKAKIPEDQRIRLGADEVGLGQDSFLGEELDDRAGKFRVRIGPLDKANYQALFPGSVLYNKVVMLTELYVTDPLEYDIEVIMAEQQARTVCLGNEQWSRLGLDSWLSSEEYIGEKTNLFTPAGH